VWGTGQYGYDGLDNLRSSQVGGRSLTHHVDAQNRLSSLSGSQSVSFGYDANGNITQRGGQSYYFDIGNRLRNAVGKGIYDYDGHGRRGWVVSANGSTQLNAYTGTGAAGRLMFSNHSTKGGTRYVYLGDKLIAEHNNQTGVSYSHTDALGSPVARTNGAGQIIGSRTRYEAYGATAAGDVPQGIGFTGHVNDPDTGLVYMQQRYYDPIAVRFLSVDPVVTDAKTGSHFNRYAYAENNPYRYVDPDGRAAHVLFGAAIGGVSGFVGGVNSGARGWALVGSVAAGAFAGAVATAVPVGGGLVVAAKNAAAGGLGNIFGQKAAGAQTVDLKQAGVQAAVGVGAGLVGAAVARTVVASQASNVGTTVSAATGAVANSVISKDNGGMNPGPKQASEQGTPTKPLEPNRDSGK
jgi:RHS repeat-associated protein